MNGRCDTKSVDLDVPRRCEPLELAERRRRRLNKGIDRWLRDCLNDVGERMPRVQLVALTTRSLDATTAEGAVRALYQQLRAIAGPGWRYFWWAEFQQRGAIHFHAIWLDSPFRTNAAARAWLRAHWRHAAIWPDVRRRSWEWFGEKAGAYVGAYAKKEGRKRYQQSFELMPKGWHVFASTRLSWSVAAHQEHEHRAHTVNTAPPFAPWYQRVGQTWVYAVEYHRPAPGGCRLPASQSRRGLRGRGPVADLPLPDVAASLSGDAGSYETSPPADTPYETPYQKGDAQLALPQLGWSSEQQKARGATSWLTTPRANPSGRNAVRCAAPYSAS